MKDLKARYDVWFDDVSSTRPDNYAPPRIIIGTPYENPTVLTRQDWRHIQGRPWAKDSNGFWLLNNAKAGRFDVRLRFPAAIGDGNASLQYGEKIYSAKFPIHATQVWFRNLDLPAGDARLLATLGQDDKGHGPWQVDVIQH